MFDTEREIIGLSAEERVAARRFGSEPLVAALETWLRAERVKLSRHNAVAKAIYLHADALASLRALPR